jgi:hypothetical protein
VVRGCDEAVPCRKSSNVDVAVRSTLRLRQLAAPVAALSFLLPFFSPLLLSVVAWDGDHQGGGETERGVGLGSGDFIPRGHPWRGGRRWDKENYVALIQRVAVVVGVAWCSRGCRGGLGLVLPLAWLGVRGGCGRGPWRCHARGRYDGGARWVCGWSAGPAWCLGAQGDRQGTGGISSHQKRDRVPLRLLCFPIGEMGKGWR